MDVNKDVCSLELLSRQPRRILSELRGRRKPMVVMSKGKPDMVIIPAELMKDRITALQAVCELAEFVR
jgi:PHD/YefM family antitoxin component YafN of YafNO toxin-antitoxin module